MAQIAVPSEAALRHHRGVEQRPPSGDQIEISYGDQRAVAVTVGGGLRVYEAAGQPVLDGYAEDAICDGARGQLLVPWPNRIRDASYEFEGRHLQLPLTEPEQGNAIHGLARWLPWQILELAQHSATLGLDLPAQPGYPFQLALFVAYELDAGGLRVTQTATNVGREPCPYGSGAHPYLSAAPGVVDDLELVVPAGTALMTDARQIPSGSHSVAGSELDFRGGRAIADSHLDTAFTGLERAADGMATVTVSRPGRVLRLWVDAAHEYLMVFTGDTLAPERRRRGLAVEPMTCAPDAFRSGAGLRVLRPGETVVAVWGIAPG